MSTLQFEVRWHGRLVGLQRHEVGTAVVLGGTRFDIVSGGVVVDGVENAAPLSRRCGDFTIGVSDTTRVIAPHLQPTFDLPWWRTASLMLILAVGGLVAVRLTPKQVVNDHDDFGRGRLTISHVAMLPTPPKPPPPKAVTTTKPAASAPAAVSMKPEGAATRTAKKREENRARAMDALRELGLTGPTATAGVFAAANDINSALDNLHGAGMANGGIGLSVRGVGVGGSGLSVGIGSIGGNGGNRDRTDPPGVNIGDHRGKHVGVEVKTEKILYIGGLDRGEIQRVMDRAMSRIRYCYERALTADADLEGKLTSMFVIGDSGEVVSTSVVQSTLGEEVDGCVNRVLKTLKFPSPKGGGTVNVTYPFVFTAH